MNCQKDGCEWHDPKQLSIDELIREIVKYPVDGDAISGDDLELGTRLAKFDQLQNELFRRARLGAAVEAKIVELLDGAGITLYTCDMDEHEVKEFAQYVLETAQHKS